jgi:DNA-binding CsgD family transcriptional regulator
LKYLLTFIVIIFLQASTFAQSNISYIHKDISVGFITDTSINWQELKEPIYNGFDNGVYWFKIVLNSSVNERIISIPESHISRVRLFVNQKEIKMLQPARYVAFSIPYSEKKTTCYLRVNCLLEARIPIEIKQKNAYFNDELVEYAITGIYLGFVLAIIVFSLFSYFSFGNITYLLYLFMVIGMSANAFYKDGLLAYFIGVNSINEVLEPVINLIVPISAIFFTVSYLEIQEKLKRLKILALSMVVITILIVVAYQLTGNFVLFTAAAILNLCSLTIFLSAGFILWNKSFYARFFAIAYGVPLLLAYDYYIFPHFGIKVLNLPLNFYKTGSILEMIIFTYGIMYQAKKINKENREMRNKLIAFTDKLKFQNKGILEREATVTELIEKFKFTIKEVEILKILATNKTNKQIAESQFISENTVKYHIKNILKKLDVKSKQDAKYHYLNYSEED